MTSTSHLPENARICVFCGANDGTSEIYRNVAHQLGSTIASRGWGLVYGGGSVGLMGAIARSVEEHGGPVQGIIPAPLTGKEISGAPIGELEIVESMHERKARMAELADAFLTLPGGFGTLDELFEMITWVQLGIHSKPIGLLNVNGFFDPLCAQIEHQIAEGFIKERFRSLLVVDNDVELLLDRLMIHTSPNGIVRWVGPEQS